MDAGRFLYNLDDNRYDEMVHDLKGKLEEFFKWYSNFKNRDPICKVELLTNDIKCSNNCPMLPNTRISVMELLVNPKTVKSMIEELGKKYDLKVEFTIRET